MTDYLREVMLQPQALRSSLANLDFSPLERFAWALKQGVIDRIVVTGMGGSLNSLYPAWLELAAAGLPAYWVDAAELLHSAPAMIGPTTLLFIVSQSGRSAEIVALLEQLKGEDESSSKPLAALLVVTNELDSPLAQSVGWMESIHPGSGIVLPMGVEPELGPSTRSYLASLAINQLAARMLAMYTPTGEPNLGRHLQVLETTIAGMEIYLAKIPQHVQQVGDILGDPQHLVFLGRGASLASALSGALALQEVVKFPAFALQTAEFRHGPLEVAGPELGAVLFAGSETTRKLSWKLFNELKQIGVRALWIQAGEPDSHADALKESIHYLPAASGIGLPLAEFLPCEMIAMHLSRLHGVEPGSFRHIGKVTDRL